MSNSEFWIYLGVLAGSVLVGALIVSWRHSRAYSPPRLSRHRRN